MKSPTKRATRRWASSISSTGRESPRPALRWAEGRPTTSREQQGNTPTTTAPPSAAIGEHRRDAARRCGARGPEERGRRHRRLRLAVTDTYRDEDTVALFVKAGAAVEEVNARMQTPLHAAAGYSVAGQRARAPRRLARHGESARARTGGRRCIRQCWRPASDGEGPVGAGSRPVYQGAKGKSPLDLAQETRMTPLVELLKRAVKLPTSAARRGARRRGPIGWPLARLMDRICYNQFMKGCPSRTSRLGSPAPWLKPSPAGRS